MLVKSERSPKNSMDLHGRATTVLPKTLQEVLDVAFNYDGFVAGGFPRYLMISADATTAATYFSRSRGDIDIFFPNEISQLHAVKELRKLKPKALLTRSFGNFADNLSIDPPRLDSTWPEELGSVTIQLIDCKFGTPEEILETFDLRNAMIGFNATHAWVDDKMLEVEKHYLLDIANWTTDFIPWRIAKYMRKWPYVGLTSATKAILPGWIIDRYGQKLKVAGTDLFNVSDKTFLEFTAKLLKDERILSNDDLLLLTFLFAQSDNIHDNAAFAEILRRNQESKSKSENYGGVT